MRAAADGFASQDVSHFLKMPADATRTLTNAQIAELLAREATTAKMPAQKALRRASRRALFWPEEAAAIYREGRSLTELTAVGPYLSRLISGWIEKPPKVPEIPDLRRGFLTLTEARGTLAAKPQASNTGRSCQSSPMYPAVHGSQ